MTRDDRRMGASPTARMSARAPLVIGTLVLAGLAAFVALRFEVTNDINEFLPVAEDRELGAVSRQIAESELSRTMVLLLTGPDEATVTAASVAFEQALRADPRVAPGMAFLEGGPAEGTDRALWELYEPRRFGFLAPDAEAARERLTDAGLAAAAARLRGELGGPMSPLTARVAPRDPLLILPSLFQGLERTRASDLSISHGRFVTSDRRGAVLFLGTRPSAFDAAAQAPLLEGVGAAFDSVNARFEGRLSLDQSGLNRFATRAAAAIEGDIKRVSIFSVLLLGGLLLVLFRSLRFVAMASIPVGAGVLVGSAAVLALFGRLHGITVAFGASLIGVSIDYVVHLYCHHTVVSPAGGPRATVAAIHRPLITGALTTAAGFMALTASSLSGLREVACFSVTGILAAFVATRTMLPGLLPAAGPRTPLLGWLVGSLGRVLSSLRTHRKRLWLVPALAVALMAVGLPGARFNDDFASLGRLDPELLAEDARVREKVTRFEQMRFVVAFGETEEDALSANDRVDRHLSAAVEAGELSAYRSLASLLPSPTTQVEVAAVFYDDASLPERLSTVFGEAGFADGAFTPFFEALRGPRPAPLGYEELLASPLAAWVRPFRVRLGDRVGIVSFVHGVADADALEARLAPDRDVLFLRQADLFEEAHHAYQRQTLQLLAWGLLAVLALLALRYREPRRTIAAFVPSVLSAGVTVSVLTLSGRGLDLVALTGLLFVVSMGVDYGVFLVDANDEEGSVHLEAALTSVLLACGSTVVGFGLLALSEHPVLASLGITAAVGIASSLLLAPTTLFLLRPQVAPTEHEPTVAPTRSDHAL